MLRRVLGAFVVVGALVLGGAVEARRTGSEALLEAPATRSPSHIVRVLDLPDIAELRRRDGTHIDLGYKFRKNEGGDWVGYLAARRYVELDPHKLAILMRTAGLAELPAPPQRFTVGGDTTIIMMIGIAAAVLGGLGLAWRLGGWRGTGSSARAHPRTAGLARR